jgi:ferritin-like metal-binding protein YciE
MAIQNMQEAFVHELKDIYYAEKQIVKALPKMAKKAQNQELRAAFQEHLEQSKEHIQRIEQVFEALGKTPRGEKCEGINGIIEEGEKLLEEQVDESVRDAMLIGAAQRVEHYEIAVYGTLCTWAEMMDLDGLDLLKEILAEEKETDKKLTKLAKEVINVEATVEAEE